MITKVAAMVGGLALICTTAYGGYQFTQAQARQTFGAWPYASLDRFEILAQHTSYDAAVRQTAIQFEIQRLREKCARSCSQYEGKALQNYIDEWQRNQVFIDSMRANRAPTQQQAAPMATR